MGMRHMASVLEARTVDFEEFVPVDLRDFAESSTALLDLYQCVEGRFVLYRQAGTPFTWDARQRLIENGVTTLYLLVTDSGKGSGKLTLPEVLALPETQLGASAKSHLLYGSIMSTIRRVLAAPESPEGLLAAREVVGTMVAELISNPTAFDCMVRIMRHDFSVYTHSVNVCVYAAALGDAFGLEREGLFELCLGAMLHDVGKTKIPQEILDKPGPLTEEEWTIVRRHPEWGLQLLAPAARGNSAVAAVVLQHHERLDGSGYPRGLQRLEVQLPARIVAVADVYEALTGQRPYRKTSTPTQAVKIIAEGLGRQFDTDVFMALEEILHL